MNQDKRFNQARQYFFNGQTDLAIDLLKELLAEDQSNAIYHAFLADCLLNKCRLYSAEYELNLALQLNPEIAYLHYIQAKIFYFRNKPKMAIDACDKTLSLDPEFVEAIRFKAQLFLSGGNKKAALESLEIAAKIDPVSTDTFSSFGGYYLQLGQLEIAYNFAEKALRESAEDEDANLLMAEICLQQGRTDDAEYHLKYVIMNNPSSNQALTLFAHLKLKKNILMGIWWRFNAYLNKLSPIQSSILLVLGFLFFNFLAQVLNDYDRLLESNIVSYGWLILVVYSWVGIPIYYKAIEKELSSFKFRSNF